MTDEKKFEFNEDIENDCLMTWKNARTLGRYKALCRAWLNIMSTIQNREKSFQ